MIKKIFKLIVSLILIASSTLAMTYFGGNLNFFTPEEYSDTFVGYISEYAYDTKEDTAKAYLAKELNGATASTVFTGYTKVEDLAESEINTLQNLSLTEKTIIDGEKGIIEYLCNDAEECVDTYILNSEEGFLYYIPPQSTGEPLTQSYFDIVFDGTKYSNCTVTTTLNMRIVSAEATTDSIYKQVIYFDDDKAFFNQELPGYTTDMYFEENENSIVAYLEHPTEKDGKFYTINQINSSLGSGYYYEVRIVKGGQSIDIDTFDSMQDIVDLAFDIDLDSSYFEKTDVGFSMPNNKYKEVCKAMAGAEFVEEIEKAWIEYQVHFRADYYVSNGRLSGRQIMLTMSDGQEIFNLSIQSTFRDFGTTEVVIPK